MIFLLHVALSICSPALSPVFFSSRWHVSFHRVFDYPLFLFHCISVLRTFRSRPYSRTPDERPPSPTTIPLIRPYFVWRTVGNAHYMNPSRATIPLIRPHECDSEGGCIRGILLYVLFVSPLHIPVTVHFSPLDLFGSPRYTRCPSDVFVPGLSVSWCYLLLQSVRWPVENFLAH